MAVEKQYIISADGGYEALTEYLLSVGETHVFLVCGNSIKRLRLNDYFERLEENCGIKVTRFSGFKPNPEYESVAEGVEAFRKSRAGTIIAVGGGSAMDVAKCIKLYSDMDQSVNYLEQKIVPNDIRLIAVPTTAGTGSEATRFAVIYYKGAKQSVSDNSCIPSVVVMDPTVLESLPAYQKKATMLDAFCHALESFWSVNSTDESKGYSKEAIKLFLENKDGYLQNAKEGNANMLLCSNLAGKAINITQTTAGHAMCYKLTGLFGYAHGHSAALVNEVLWPYMIENTQKCADKRGEAYLDSVFSELGKAMGCMSAMDGAEKFADILGSLELERPESISNDKLEMLVSSVNPVRLKNNPVSLDAQTIELLYHKIV